MTSTLGGEGIPSLDSPTPPSSTTIMRCNPVNRTLLNLPPSTQGDPRFDAATSFSLCRSWKTSSDKQVQNIFETPVQPASPPISHHFLFGWRGKVGGGGGGGDCTGYRSPLFFFFACSDDGLAKLFCFLSGVYFFFFWRGRRGRCHSAFDVRQSYNGTGDCFPLQSWSPIKRCDVG